MQGALIITDLEGVSGVKDKLSVTDESSSGYKEAVRLLMEETNSAINALYDGGAEIVYVVDGHASGKNFIQGALDKRATQVYTWELNSIINNVECFIMIGTHAMAGTKNAFFDHTQLWEAISGYYYNGVRCGEIAQMGVYAGRYDIPCVAVSGDEMACREAQALYNGLEIAVVKTAVNRDIAIPVGEEEAKARIYSAVKKGFINRKNVKPLKVELPLRIRVEYTNEKDCNVCLKNSRDAVKINALTLESVRSQIEDYSDVLLES